MRLKNYAQCKWFIHLIIEGLSLVKLNVQYNKLWWKVFYCLAKTTTTLSPTHTHNEEHWGSSPTGVLSLSVVYGFKASCMGRRALKQHIKQELIICQPKWQRKRKASLWMARQEKRKVIMLPTSLHLKNSVLILAFPFVTRRLWKKNLQQYLCTCAV